MDFLILNESWIRFAIFFVSLGVFAGLEALYPKKAYKEQRGLRWLTNYAIVSLGTIFLRLAFPLLATGLAAQWQVGVFHWLSLPMIITIPLSLIIFDMVIYFQHRIFHMVPLLWRLHRVHHSDIAIDTSTALRFHPIEIVLSMAIKMLTVLAFGIPPEAVILFEIILSSSAIFNHANWNLREWDKPLQKVLVTPNMHRIHHSIYPSETNSNYGFCLSVWDRLFGTFTKKPATDWPQMKIGLKEFRSAKEQRLDQILLNPFQ